MPIQFHRCRSLAAVAVVATLTVQGAFAAGLVRFDIAAQPLGNALRALASQADTNVMFNEPLVSGLSAAPLQMEGTLDEALARVLADTGITYRFLNEHTVVLSAGDGKLDDAGNPKADASGLSSVKLAQADAQSGLRQANAGEQSSDFLESSKGDSRSQGEQLEEVVVTAQKRTERLQDVPISITVLSGEDLDKSRDQGITEALRRVPGVIAVVAGQNGGTQLTIRGVSASGSKFLGASPIGYYMDAVPFGLARSAVVPDANPYDLDRVEVLRGPQGTLYGANAQNGVVRILTHDPVLNEFELKTCGSLSSTDHGGGNSRIDAAVNIPLISDKLAARAVVGYQDLSGWIDGPTRKDINDAEIVTGRFKLKAQPTEQLSIGASAWLSRSDYGAPSWSADNRQSPFTREAMSTDYDIFGVTVGYDFSGFSVTSASSYIDYIARGFQNFDSIAPFFGLTTMDLETIDGAEVFTQEVNLASTHGGPWRWSVGGSYRDSDSPELQDFDIFTPLVPLNFTYKSESFAVFGELTRALLDDRIELTAGLRYFEDHVTQRELQNFDGLGPLFTSGRKFDKVSPRAVLTWHPSNNVTTYVSYSEGFRSGTDQGLLVTATYPDFPPVGPDNLTNYELGAKGSVWGGRVTFDMALFFIDWQDVQQPLTVPFSGTNITAVVNGESASGLGFEFATTAELMEGWTLGVNFSYNDLTNDDEVITFVNDSTLPGNPLVPVVLFPEGSRLNFSPEYTVGISTDYVFPLGSGGYKGRFSASANYASELSGRILVGTTSTAEVSETALLSRASFEIESPHHWAASLFVDNIANEEDPYPGNPTDPHSIRPRPRTIGLQLEYRL